MASTRGIDDFPRTVVDDWPLPIRQQFARRARAGAALRVYRRRGWNPTAVLFQFDRESAAVKALEDKYRFEHENPALF